MPHAAKRPKAKKPVSRPEPNRAKVFWSGRSQAVRLPKEFRFDVDTVRVRRDGNAIVLEPLDEWPEGWIEWLKSGPLMPEDFKRHLQGRARPVPDFDAILGKP